MTWRDIRESLDGDEVGGVGGEMGGGGEQGLNAVTGFLTHAYCSSTLPMSGQKFDTFNRPASVRHCSTNLPMSDIVQPALSVSNVA